MWVICCGETALDKESTWAGFESSGRRVVWGKSHIFPSSLASTPEGGDGDTHQLDPRSSWLLSKRPGPEEHCRGLGTLAFSPSFCPHLCRMSQVRQQVQLFSVGAERERQTDTPQNKAVDRAWEDTPGNVKQRNICPFHFGMGDVAQEEKTET